MNEVVKVFVALLQEGIDVWRPVAAEHVEGDVYRLLEAMPRDELWKFPSGARVRCEQQLFSGGKRGLAAVEIVET